MGVPESSSGTTAACVAAENDVRDLHVLDCVFNDGGNGDIGRGDDIGDVAVDEDVAGLEAEEGGFGDAGVGAADPDCQFKEAQSACGLILSILGGLEE